MNFVPLIEYHNLKPTFVPALRIDRPQGSFLCGCRPRLTGPSEQDPGNLTGLGQRVNPTQISPKRKKKRHTREITCFWI